MQVETLILGAGAAGLMCAPYAAAGGRTLVVDHAKRPGDKIRISGGGRCNFTNLGCQISNFISANPHFAKSALARYTPWDFIELISRHGLTYHEKTLGQLFCDQKSGAIIEVLIDELTQAGAELWLETNIREVQHVSMGYKAILERGGQTHTVTCKNLVVATGGKSIPKMGATGLGYELARQFGLEIVETRPGLVPFTFTGPILAEMAARAGLSLAAEVQAGGKQFREGMLFTHRGLSGPSMLQASSYWQPGTALLVNFCPSEDIDKTLRQAKQDKPKRSLAATLKGHLPEAALEFLIAPETLHAPLQHLSDARITALSAAIQASQQTPAGTQGYRTAEVTVGGVDTAGLSSKTMAALTHPGLYFIGEVVDVTGWLGGYNFQWAWASAVAAGKAIAA